MNQQEHDILRALAERWKAIASTEAARVGDAGAVLEMVGAAFAGELLALLDSLPVPAHASTVRSAVLDAIEWSRKQPLSTEPEAERIASRVVETLPVLTADEVRAVVREACSASMDRCGFRGAFGVQRDPVLSLIAARVAEQLAGRAVALSAEEREVAAWLRKLVDRPVFHDLRSDPVVAEHVKMCRASVTMLDRLLTGDPAVDLVQSDPPALSQAVALALADYSARGIAPPQPIRAILEGDLFSAVAFAEHSHYAGDEFADALAMLPVLAARIRDTLPSDSWGSRERVERWIRRPRS